MSELAAYAAAEAAGTRLCCFIAPVTPLWHLVIVKHGCVRLVFEHNLTWGYVCRGYQVAAVLG
jgi:hypothetical protein